MLVGTALFLTARLRSAHEGRRRAMWLAGGAVALATIALVVTFSRSSWPACCSAPWSSRWAWLGRRKGTIAVLVTVLVLAVGLAGITELRHPHNLRMKLDTTKGLNKLTGGRVFLVKAGVRMFDRHPVAGVGLAGFPLAFAHYRTTHAASLGLNDSHTTVVTIAAEQGLIGLAAFAGLLVTFFATTLHKRRFGADRRLYLWQASLVACVLSIFVHSLTYNAFFEDPYVWVFMALASAVVTRIVRPAPPATVPSTTPDGGGWSPSAAAKAAIRDRKSGTTASR